MAAEVVTALIAASGTVVLAGASYWFTKKREREVELRREKLAHYKDFVSSLSGVISGESTPDGHRHFSRSCNSLNLVAPQSVLVALQAFQEEIKVSNELRSREQHDKLMSKLFYEMRRDLGISPEDNEATFRVGLRASGIYPTDPKGLT